MKQHRFSRWHISFRVLGLLSGFGPAQALGEPPTKALSTFHLYTAAVESKLNRQHQSPDGFLAPVHSKMQLRQGELIIEQLTPSSAAGTTGALLHHWRGTAFALGAKAADLEQLLKNFSSYPQSFAPLVIQAKVLVHQGDRMQVVLRVRQRHIITVVMDTDYDVTFGRLDAHHGYSISRSTRMSEIDSPGTANERVLSADEEHGFLWRQNTYWSYEERGGGLYMQVESVSLSRSIPTGLGWAIRPFVESVPRESLEFALRSTCDALRK